MTGFDNVATEHALSLFGTATVPVTHLLHLIVANYTQQFASAVQGRFARLKEAVMPTYSFAFA